jgi:hypothetical protein
MYSTVLRAQLESALASRVSSAFTDLDRRVVESVSTGLTELDLRTGGLPRGAVTEIVGPVSSGRTSAILSTLAEATGRGECVALVDGHDRFTPVSAAAAGADLRRLLWIRCHDLDAALKTTDLLVKGGGFGVIAVDTGDLPLVDIRTVPLTTWFRFQRTIENTPTILLLSGQEPVAQSCAALVLRMQMQEPAWTGEIVPPHSLRLGGNTVNVELVRCRQSSLSSWPRYVRMHLHS